MVSRLDRIKAAQEASKAKAFSPLDLNEGEVQAIFNRCLKTAETKEIEYTTLFREDLGYDKTETPVHFDKDIIKQNIQTIKYLYGQLSLIHQGQYFITSEQGKIKYGDTQWTENNGVLMEFFHLGAGAHIMTPFVAKVQRAGLVNTLVPTLSPKDPAFPAWWEAHRAEWED